jgi:hypothetical protein
MGVILGSAGPDYRESIFESFTRRVFWTNGVTAYVLPAGDVRIWVWTPRQTTGKFVVGIGVEEAGIDYGNVLGMGDLCVLIGCELPSSSPYSP